MDNFQFEAEVTTNFLGNAIIFGDKKTNFYRIFADWIELWCASPSFKFACQTKSVLVTTLQAQADLIDELIDDGYEFVKTTRFHSDPTEMHFSQYRQMCGGRFLISLREVLNSERILSCRSLIKENINFWEENIDRDAEESLDSINSLFDKRADNIMEAIFDDGAREVATTISGYVAKKPIKQSFCNLCKQTLGSQEVDLEHDSYLKLLSRRGLFVPSRQLADFVCSCFSFLDFRKKEIVLLEMPVAKVATYILKRYGSFPHFSCNMHHDWSFKFASKIVVNIFFNNKQNKN